MFKKIFKTVLIVNLCLGLSITTNANSVNVSDGSAFITKSELAYKLNNLSSRMAQLENSLNSKIDSLVSSYLTRNGIWNGSLQSLTTVASNGHSFVPEWKSGNVGTKDFVVTHFDEAVVLNTTKSGLLFGTLGYGNNHKGSANNWYYGVKIGSRNGWTWDYNCSIQLSFYEKDLGSTTQTTGTLKSVIRIGDTLGAANWASGAYTLLAIAMPNWNVIPFQFFVEKNKEVWWKWTDSVSLFQASEVHTYDTEGATMDVKLIDLRVY